FGIIDSFHAQSKNRIEPECELFGKCGGCLLRHISYESELSEKQSFVADAMLRLGGIDLPVANIIPSPEVERYRNKVQLPVYTDDCGVVHSGFFAGRSHRVIECNDCRLQPQIFTQIAAKVCELLTLYKISTYHEIKRVGLVRHIYMRHSVLHNTVMLCLVINGKKLPYQEEIVKALTNAFSEISTISLNINRECTNVILGNKNIVLYGDGTLQDELCCVPVALNPLSFFQVNTHGAERLYAVASLFADVKSDDKLLDLYCGAGTIGLSMAHECKELIGVEIVPEAIESAIKSAEQMGLTNTRFICGDAGKAAVSLQKEGIKP
ncbi:MAG: 23S rRNA (uracil(1939)-C(5))-methyltransferase RlmD, partial [Oscillospiraceae bacterium]